ncbi:putative Fungal N-terminal domain-containing protein [Seiridium unicorne]|uniref:Fungal N-terminal domain-containing protein n=1 Tax=Seiridium unicorne TaxID=138068 RepID=A0ABR2UEA6_9PEZI
MATAPMRYIYDHFNYVEEFPRTAAEYLYDLVLQSKVSHSLFSAINDECGGLADTFHEFDRSVQPSEQLNFLLANPDIAEDWGYSRICLAITHRSFPTMKRYFIDDPTQNYDLPSGHCQFAPMELAVGWSEGLRFLVDHKCHIASAFDIACHRDDIQSASILLSTDNVVFEEAYISKRRHLFDGMPSGFWTLATAARIGSTGIFRLVGQELWKRVVQSKMLALRHLTVKEQKEFGLGQPWTLTYGAPNLYQRLAWRTTLPEKFDICTEGSPHCNEILGGRYFADGLEFHQILYDIGFVELDALCAHGRTPLAEFCDRNPITGRSKLWFRVVIWFLENGAEPSFPFENQEPAVWPHLQFFVALNIRNIGAMDERVRRSCQDRTIHDQCECYCSSRGCIAPFLLWRCTKKPGHATHHHCRRRNHRRMETLKAWFQKLRFSRAEKEHCCRKICRLELFERMGIAHTCCAEWDLCNEEDSELCFERAELQSEDGVAADQLELLLRRYDLMRKCLHDISIERFWKTWWEIVDIILPPLLPEEACREPRWLLEGEEYWDDDKVEDIKHQVSQAREERWATMLRNAGYKKWNFKNVIKHHFVGYLKIAQAHKERKGRWRHRRLMAKPRFIVEVWRTSKTKRITS